MRNAGSQKILVTQVRTRKKQHIPQPYNSSITNSTPNITTNVSMHSVLFVFVIHSTHYYITLPLTPLNQDSSMGGTVNLRVY